MNKELKRALNQFHEHFLYSPEFPPDVDFNQAEYAAELLKCVEDDFDYTIEKYGTKLLEKGNVNNLVID